MVKMLILYGNKKFIATYVQPIGCMKVHNAKPTKNIKIRFTNSHSATKELKNRKLIFHLYYPRSFLGNYTYTRPYYDAGSIGIHVNNLTFRLIF